MGGQQTGCHRQALKLSDWRRYIYTVQYFIEVPLTGFEGGRTAGRVPGQALGAGEQNKVALRLDLMELSGD